MKRVVKSRNANASLIIAAISTGITACRGNWKVSRSVRKNDREGWILGKGMNGLLCRVNAISRNYCTVSSLETALRFL